MARGKGFDRLRLASVAVATVSLFGGASRSARAGTGATITQGGVTWYVFNSNSGPGTAPFTQSTCPGGKRPARAGQAVKAPAGTGSGCAMNVTSASLGAQSDAYDGVFLMAVNGTQYRDPDGAFATTANSVSGSPRTIAGLTVSGDYFFFSGSPTVRALYTFTNPTGAAINVTVALGHNVGSDTATVVEATGDGDTVVEGVDAWTVTSDAAPFSDPVVLLSRFGQGGQIGVASSTVVFAAGEEDMIDNYSLSVPAGQTRRLMLFSRLGADAATVIAAAPTFNNLASIQAAGLTAGLTPAQIAEIANWSPAGAAAPILPVPVFSDWSRWFLMFAVGAAGALGVARWRRRGAAR